MAFDPHVPEIAGVIQLADSLCLPSIVFAVISALFIALLIAGAFLKEILLAVSTPRHVPR